MSEVSAEIEIAAPVTEVWETIMDPSRLADWVTIHKTVKNASSAPLKSGATMEQSMSVRGVTFTVHWTLDKVDAPHRADWKGEGPARSRARIRYDLSEVDGGSTRFVYRNEFEPPGGRLGAVAGRFIVGATSEREARNSLARLKRLLEK